MEWKQTAQHRWEVMDPEFEGTALLKETNSGYIVSIHVKNIDFDMDLLDERDFFEWKKDALKFLEKKMGKTSY